MEHDITSSPARPWKTLGLRAVLAAVAAVAVTFSPDHSPAYGFAVVAGFAVLTGALDTVLAMVDGRMVSLLWARSVLLLATGLTAASAIYIGFGLELLVVLIAVVGVVTAASEFLLSRNPEPGTPTTNDHRILGSVAALLVVGVLLARDNSVVVVGVFGAWAAVTAVFTLITAFTLKWEGDRRPDPMVNP